MTETRFAEAIILSTGALVFLGLLIGVVALVSALRQHRIQSSERLFHVTPRTMRTDEHEAIQIDIVTDGEDTPVVGHTPLDDNWRMPVQEGTPDLVNIMIEPDPGPTREQQNVRRLIAYLKSEVRQTTSGSTRSA